VFYAHDDAYSTSESQIVQQALIARNPKPVAVIRTSVSDTIIQSQITETRSTLQLSPPTCATLAPLPCAELRLRLNTALLKGRFQTPLGEIRFTAEREVIQSQFYVAQVRMN